MNRRRALMVFSGAFEFKRDNNKEIKERENDEVELPKLAKAVEEHERNISKPPTDQVKILIIHQFFSTIILAFCNAIFNESPSTVFCSFIQYSSKSRTRRRFGCHSSENSTSSWRAHLQNIHNGTDFKILFYSYCSSKNSGSTSPFRIKSQKDSSYASRRSFPANSQGWNIR